LGYPGDVRHDRVREAGRRVAEAARQHGKLAVVGGVQDAEHCRDLLADGFAPLIFAGIDSDILALALRSRFVDWRARAQLPPIEEPK
jgi:2-keto-3-deoxy-L-rhamnonate aldolase RhmA